MKRSIKAIQKGFTLIELVVVLVIIGILAAIAVPKYIDLSVSANKSAFQATAGAIQSAAAINYAAWAASNNSASDGATDFNGMDCATIMTKLVTGGALPAGYGTSGNPVVVGGGTLANGSDATCPLTGPNSQSTDVHIIYTTS